MFDKGKFLLQHVLELWYQQRDYSWIDITGHFSGNLTTTEAHISGKVVVENTLSHASAVPYKEDDGEWNAHAIAKLGIIPCCHGTIHKVADASLSSTSAYHTVKFYNIGLGMKVFMGLTWDFNDL